MWNNIADIRNIFASKEHETLRTCTLEQINRLKLHSIHLSNLQFINKHSYLAYSCNLS